MPYTIGPGGNIQLTKSFKKPARRIPQARVPRERKAPLFHKPQGLRTTKIVETNGPGDRPPPGIIATLPEWCFYWSLQHEYKLIPGQDFQFQSSLMGGHRQLGGLVADFMLPDYFPPGLVCNIEGWNWHRYTTLQRAKEVLDAVRYQAKGYKVVYVLEDDAIQRRRYAVGQALKGVQLFAQTV